MRLSRNSGPSPGPSKERTRNSLPSPRRKVSRVSAAVSATNISRPPILAPVKAVKPSPSTVDQGGLSPAFARQRYGSMLTTYELKEINDFREIYYVGQLERKALMAGGFDTPTAHYKSIVGDHIAYRYEILGVLGKGAFGEVLKCFDHKTKTVVAVKVTVNTPIMKQQGSVEVENLRLVGTGQTTCVCHYLDSFMFRNHLCIVTEILGPSLFFCLKERDYEGISVAHVKSITRDLLTALEYIHSKKVIHCDLKPENILLAGIDTHHARLIDFGTSCMTGKQTYNYLQSRFYRAPEVILQLPYSTPIDMWSLGCIICELLTGKPLFAGQNEFDQLGRFVEVVGHPPLEMIQASPRRERYFGPDNRLKTVPGRQPKQAFKTKLPVLLKTTDAALLDLLGKCLEWDPSKRLTASAGLKHKWISVSSRGRTPQSSRP